MITATTTKTSRAPSLRTAIDLKKAIERIPDTQAKLGNQVLVEWEWYVDHGCHEMDDEEPANIEPEVHAANEDMVQQFDDLKKLAKAKTTTFKQDMFWSAQLQDFALSLTGFKDGKPIGFLQLELSHIKELYQHHSEPSPFGDQKALKTTYDPKVRKGRQISKDKFEVSATVIEAVQDTWVKHFNLGGACRAEAYKINLYAKDDFFSMHKDTPAKGLMGTFMLGLGVTSQQDHCYAGLKVISKEGKVKTWKSVSGGWCAFYPDCLHEVVPLPKGYRANIAFKIYQVRGPDDDISLAQKMAKKLTKMLAGEEQFGLVLSHDYSVNETAFKGIDNAFVQAVKLLPGVIYEIVPVIITRKAEWPSEGYSSFEDYNFSSRVYSVRPEDVAYCLNPNSVKKPEDVVRSVNFYAIDEEHGYCWHKYYEDDIANTGNESRPGEEDSIYMHRAIVVTSWSPEAPHKKSKHN